MTDKELELKLKATGGAAAADEIAKPSEALEATGKSVEEAQDAFDKAMESI